MTPSFARARARGCLLSMDAPAQWEERSRTARAKGDRYAAKCRRVLGSAASGTGPDHGRGEFSPVRAREHGAGLVVLSSLVLSISVRLQGVPDSHRRGSREREKTDFLGLNRPISSHFVPSTSTYLERAKRGDAVVRQGRGRLTTNLTNLTNESVHFDCVLGRHGAPRARRLRVLAQQELRPPGRLSRSFALPGAKSLGHPRSGCSRNANPVSRRM